MNALLTKDDRAPDSFAPTAQDYHSLLVRARREQLQLSAANLQRLAETFDKAAQAILERVSALPVGTRGAEWLSAQLNLLRQIDALLTDLERDFAGLLDLSMLSTAQQAAEREQKVATLVGAGTQVGLDAAFSRSVTLSAGSTVSVEFGRVALGAVERTVSRYYNDGIQLSKRLYNLDVITRKTIEDTLLQGIAAGTAARDIAKQLEGRLMAAGANNPRNRAMTIAKNEINLSYRESALLAMTDGAGNTKDYISAAGMRLSSSHKLNDICDVYCSSDTGLGPGNYPPGDAPVSHTGCLCNFVSILVAFPDMQFVRKTPDTSAVPASDVARLARQGDPVAQRFLAGGA